MSASLELQTAVIAILRADAALVAMLAPKGIYDRVPPGAGYPLVSWGPEQAISDDASCIAGEEIFLQLDVWSRQPGFAETKKIASRVKLILHHADLAMPGPALVDIEVETIRYMRDPDGLTSHGVITLKAMTETAWPAG